MNTEIRGICAFIMSIMIFSILTPFAYAIKEPSTVELSTQKQVSSSCSNNVWFDELDWSEYQKLISSTVQTIDGFGNKALQAQEAAANKSGVGTNPDVLNAKHIFLPGVNGQPALLYDVMKDKAVDPSTVCHLNNLFSSGRVAYATRLVDTLRYCSTASNVYCDKTLTSAGIEKILDSKQGLNSTNMAEKLSQTQLNALEQNAPSAVVETSDAKIILNADTNLFFPETITEFASFIRSLNWVDTWIAFANGASMVRSIPDWAKGIKGIYGRGGALLKGMVSRASIGEMASKIAINPKYVKTLDVLSTQIKSLDLTKTNEISQIGETLTNLKKVAQTSGDSAMVAKCDNALAKLNLAGTAKDGQVIIRAEEIGADPMTGLVGVTKPAIKESLNALTTDIRNGVGDIISSNKMPDTWAVIKQLPASVKGTKANMATLAIGALLRTRGGYLGYLLAATQATQSLFMGALWFRNSILTNPQFNAQGVVEFDLNNNIANYVDKRDETHFLDVKKTYMIPTLSNFLTNIVDRFFISTAGLERKDASELQNKVKNIQDIVFILDQDAITSPSENSKAINTIAQTQNGDYWTFFSKFPSSTLIYNFEHPLGYTPKGKSALFLGLRNINIYGISGMPNKWFTSPIDTGLPLLRTLRDVSGMLTLLGTVPAGFSILGRAAGAGAASLVSIPAAWFGYRFTVDLSRGGYDAMFDTTSIDPNVLCKNKFTVDDRNVIRILKFARAALATGSAAAMGTKATPFVLVGFAFDITQLGANFLESNTIDRITKDLQTCVDTDFEVLALKDIPNAKELQNQSKDFLSPLKADALKVFNMLSPEVGAQFDSLAANMKVQVMHLQVNAKDLPLASVVGTEVYNVHFKDANIRWFQGAGCNIDFCQQSGNGYKCMTQNGYRLIDENGNPILDGIPQALSLRMKMDEGYVGIVQRVLEVKKENGSLFDIHPQNVVVSNPCLKQSLVNLTGTTSFASSAQDKAISDAFGDFEAIYTPEAEIWFDGNDATVQFSDEKVCSNGVTYGAREVVRFNDTYIKIYRDTDGKIEIVGNDSQVRCDFKLGSEGAIGFSNALIRSGFAQPKTENMKAVDFSDVYHVFIYNLISADKSEISKYSTEECTLPDGTKGIRPVIETDDPMQTEQWNTLLAGMCYANIKGTGNSSVNFNDSMVTVVDPTGVMKTYKVLGFDYNCGGGLGGYRVQDENGVESCLYMEKGPDGQPQMRVNAQSPIPLLWATGLGGSMMYDPSSGRISIKNEFPFAINPSYSVYGGGGLGMIVPGVAPWGGKATETTGAEQTGINKILAALPWMPDGLELALFAIALAGGLLFVRIRFRKEKGP